MTKGTTSHLMEDQRIEDDDQQEGQHLERSKDHIQDRA